MPIRTVWLIKDRVILSQPVGDISETDIEDFMADLDRLTAPFGKEAMVHVIQDGRKIGKPFSKIGKVVEFLGMLRRIKGWYLVLNRPGNRFFEFVVHFTTQIVGIKTRPAYHTYEELCVFLLDQDPSLPLPETLPDLFEKAEPAEVRAVS
jgi:hypothetical protein